MDRFHAMTVFQAVAEQGGFAAAARRLRLSPAAVTRTIATLEEHLGTRLLVRTTRRVRLTEAGAGYLADCGRILATLEEAEAAAAGSHAEPRGTLRISAPSQFGRLHMAPALPDFLEACPGLTVELLLADRIVDLVEDEVDIALRIGTLGTASLIAIRLGLVRRVVVAAPAYLEQRGKPETPEDLQRHQLILPTTLSSGDGWTFLRNGRPSVLQVPARLRTNQPDVAIDAARAGLGLTRVPIYQVAADLRTGRLAIVLERYEEPAIPVSLVTVEGRHAPAKVRRFIDAVAPKLRAVLDDLRD